MSTVYETTIGNDMFASFTSRDQHGNIVPACAESWDVSDDGLTYTFHLREGLVWSDGHPLVAADFVAGLHRVFNPKTITEQAAIIEMIKNGRAISHGLKPLESLGVSAPDDRTVIIELDYPSPTFIGVLGNPRGAPLPRHVFDVHGERWIKPANVVSNGPFLLKDWQPNDYVLLEKNPTYFDVASVKLEKIYFYPTEDYNSAVKRFRAGELDLNTQLPTQQVKLLKEILPDAIRIGPSLSITYIVLNHERAPFDDVRVRTALAMAIDRDAIANKIMRMGEEAATRFTPAAVADYEGPVFSFNDLTMDERRAKAKELLAEAGYGPGSPLVFEYRIRATADGKRHAAAIVQMWKQVGVKPRILGTEVKTHYNDIQEGNFDVADAGWQSLDSPEDFLYLTRSEAGPQNYGRFFNETYDKMMNEALLEPKIEKRYALMAEAEQYMLDQVGSIPLYYSTNRALVGTHVQGFEVNAVDSHRSQYMWIQDQAGDLTVSK
jgi:oligopeptide transport system substrate-binding protein